VRDSYILVETIDDMTKRFSDQLDATLFSEIREQLLARHHEITSEASPQTAKKAEAKAKVDRLPNMK
jgi:hypothetical protein